MATIAVFPLCRIAAEKTCLTYSSTLYKAWVRGRTRSFSIAAELQEFPNVGAGSSTLYNQAA